MSNTETLGAPQVEVHLDPTPDGASFAQWKSYLSYASRVELSYPDDAAGFAAHVRLYFIRDVMFSDSAASHPHHIVRTSQDLLVNPIDRLVIQLHIEGTYEGRAGRMRFCAGPGDISVLDMALPLDLSVSGFRSLALTVPRDVLPAEMRTRVLSGRVPPAERAITQLAARSFRHLADLMPSLSEADAYGAVLALLQILECVTRTDSTEAPVPEADVGLVLYDRARMAIERDLKRRDLKPEAIAATLGVSRTTLYRIFEKQGGIQAYIRERRLWRCYEILSLDLQPDKTIGEIGSEYGFLQKAYFTRVFSTRFGLTPREMRLVARNKRVAIQGSKTGGVPYHWIGEH